MKILKGQTAVFDIDDTLVLWDKSEYPTSEHVRFNHCGYDITIVPHKKNINTLIKFAKLGYQNILWSRSGISWVKAVVRILGLEKYVHLMCDKPLFYIDDKNADVWMQRIWRNPVTGKEEAFDVREA